MNLEDSFYRMLPPEWAIRLRYELEIILLLSPVTALQVSSDDPKTLVKNQSFLARRGRGDMGIRATSRRPLLAVFTTSAGLDSHF